MSSCEVFQTQPPSLDEGKTAHVMEAVSSDQEEVERGRDDRPEDWEHLSAQPGSPAHSNTSLALEEQAKLEKFKTALCNEFAAGSCHRGQRCTFAHGEAELRARPQKPRDPAKFKTVLCQHLIRSGFCFIGERCLFAHGEQELRRPPGSNDLSEKQRHNYKKQLCREWEAGRTCARGSRCTYAHGHKEIGMVAPDRGFADESDPYMSEAYAHDPYMQYGMRPMIAYPVIPGGGAVPGSMPMYFPEYPSAAYPVDWYGASGDMWRDDEKLDDAVTTVASTVAGSKESSVPKSSKDTYSGDWHSWYESAAVMCYGVRQW